MFPEMQLWLRVLLTILVAFLVAFGTTPIVKSFAQKVGAMDTPDGIRRIHTHPIPRMGGMAIFLGFLLSVVLFAEITKPVQGILIGCIIAAVEWIVTGDFSVAIALSGLIAGGSYDIVHNLQKMKMEP